jgi:hypothetical protein
VERAGFDGASLDASAWLRARVDLGRGIATSTVAQG